MNEMNNRSGDRRGVEGGSAKQGRFNAEQLTEYLNMEAQYKDMTRKAELLFANRDEMTDAQFEDLSRRYAYATIQMIKMRSFVRGPSYGATK